MSTRTHECAPYSRALLSLAINTALALGWQAVGATPPPVVNCNSAGTGSLAAAIADPGTGDGDTIDLTPLKHVCSRITLGDLAVSQNSLYIEGPGAKYLTLDGGNTARVLHHDGNGTLVISAVTVANGSFTSGSKPKGGCLYSKGNLSLVDVDVQHCSVEGTSPSTYAYGGAVYTAGNTHLLRSTITDSHAVGAYGVTASGGGVFAKQDFAALYSTISQNTAEIGPGSGGGVSTHGDVNISSSTISGNKADLDGGLRIGSGGSHTAVVVDSTISGNVGASSFGGIWSNTPLTVANSTIAFNRAGTSGSNGGAGLYSTASVTLTSTIITGNSGFDGPDDLGGGPMATVAGSDNLIFKSSLMLPMSNNTTGVCPKLDVLADNGGPTLTHGLESTSAAIDQGSAPITLTLDQRLEPRVTGSQADIGAVEWKPADKLERMLASGFDGLCDQ